MLLAPFEGRETVAGEARVKGRVCVSASAFSLGGCPGWWAVTFGLSQTEVPPPPQARPQACSPAPPPTSPTGSEAWDSSPPPPPPHLLLMSTARVGGGRVFQLPPSLEGGADPHPHPLLTMMDTVTLRLGPAPGPETNFYCKTGTFQVARMSDLASSPTRGTGIWLFPQGLAGTVTQSRGGGSMCVLRGVGELERLGLPWRLSGKKPACPCRRQETGFDP